MVLEFMFLCTALQITLYYTNTHVIALENGFEREEYVSYNGLER